MITWLMNKWFPVNTLVEFNYPDLPMRFLVKEDKFQFTEDYYTPEVSIPKGFITDGASTPRLLKGFYPGYYKYFPAAAVHDYLYGEGLLTRKECDALLRDLIRYRLKMGIQYWLIMWLAVRIGGKNHYINKVLNGNKVLPVN